MAADIYRGYKVRTYPLLGPENHAVQVVAKQWAILNTATGEVLEPYRCTDWNPASVTQVQYNSMDAHPR